VKLVADRFVVVDAERVVDLASGEDVVFRTSTAGGATEQMRWTNRCDRFARLHHPAMARLVDYGIFGEHRETVVV